MAALKKKSLKPRLKLLFFQNRLKQHLEIYFALNQSMPSGFSEGCVFLFDYRHRVGVNHYSLFPLLTV